MGRVTRNSNGGPGGKIPPPTNGSRKTLINATPKRGHCSQDCGDSDGKEESRDNTVFDFKNEVGFDYVPRTGGFGTVLEFMKRGNEGVKGKILDECNLILECRVCNNLFRSPRDFVTHKDKHCTEKYQRLTPAGISEILRLAQNSFKLNSSDSDSSVCVLPAVCDQSSDEEMGAELSFDVNHLVPMLNRAINPDDSGNKFSPHFQPKELEELTNLEEHGANGVTRTIRQLPRKNGAVKIKGKYKSMEKGRAALLGANGKTAAVGKPKSIAFIVDKLTEQWALKHSEESAKESQLTCGTCQVLCSSEKALRIHARQEHLQVKQDKVAKRKAAEALNGITKEIKGMLFGESQSPVNMIHPLSKSVTPKPRHRIIMTEDPAQDETQFKVSPLRNSARTSFRRLTNNSFSSTLETTQLPVALNVEPPHLPRKVKKSNTFNAKSSSSATEEETPDYRAMINALFPAQRRKGIKTAMKLEHKSKPKKEPSSPPQPPRRLACLKCCTEFLTEQEMSVHLGNCVSVHSKNHRISIIDRHDYLKPANVVNLEHGNPPTKASSFNNNENEILASREDKNSEVIENETSCRETSTSSPPPWIPPDASVEFVPEMET